MDKKPTYAELEKRIHELEQANAACQQIVTELRQSEDRFRRLWEQSPLGYQSLDAQGRFVEVNQSWIDILGYAREEVIGRPFADFLHPDWQEHFRLNFPRFKAVGEILGVEFEMVKKDGSLISVSFNGRISRDDDGQFRQTHCILHDITERKRAEEAISQSQQTFSELIERAPFGIYVVDSGFCIAHMSINSQKGAFRNVRPVIGRDFAEAVHILWPEPIAAEIIGHFRHVLETGEPYYSPRFINPRADLGISESYEWELHRMTLPDGQFGVICYYFDSTKLREAEVALQASDELNRRILNELPAHICVIDSHGVIVTVNEGWTHFAAANDAPGSSTVSVGANYLELCRQAAAENDAAQALDGIRAVLAGRAPNFSMEYPCHAPNEQRWFLMIVAPFGADGIGGAIITHIDITWRSRAEQTQRLLADLTAASPTAIVIHDTEGHFFYANEKAFELHGYTPEEFLALSLSEVDVPASAHQIQERIAKLRAQGAATFEVEHRRKDGSVFPLLVSARLTTWEGREAIMSVATDITESKKAGEALSESEERLRLAWLATRDVIWDWDIGKDEQLWNPAGAEVFGWTDAIDSPQTASWWSERIHPDDRQRVIEGFDKVLENVLLNRWSDEYRFYRQDGSTANVLDRGYVIRNESGKPKRMIGAMQDITERKQVEESLRQRAEEVERLLEAVPAAVWIAHDPQCQIITGNRRANKFYETRTGENVSASTAPEARRFFSPDGCEIPAVELPMQKAVATNKDVQDAEIHVQLSSGKRITMVGNAVPLHDQDGKVRGCIGAFMDITGRKQAEETLRQFNQKLEKKVTERTALAEARAKQLQALAIELIETEERERRQFAHLLHDDLQQMLAAAKMQVQAVAETLSSERMLSDAVKLLDESIAKSRRLSHQLSPAILHQAGLITALGWLCRQAKEQFGLHVELDIETELLIERTPQKVFLFRSVQELLFNIFKHAGVKSARVVVTSSEDSITITVSDQGRGFDPQILEKRTDNLGFGLLTIKERAGYVGGKFTIESTPGQGSRFTLTVPNAAAIGEEEAALDPLTIEEPNHLCPGAKISRGGSICVLFVDDHRVMRQGLMNLVKGQPAIQVAGEAANGREAIEQAHKLLPDVILMDVSMPEMDGIEATRRIKEEFPHIRVIGLTMHDDEQISASMNQAGAEVTLSKTLSAAEVINAIYGAIE